MVLGLKPFTSSAATVPWIEMVYMICKGQVKPRYDRLSVAEQFEALTACSANASRRNGAGPSEHAMQQNRSRRNSSTPGLNCETEV